MFPKERSQTHYGFGGVRANKAKPSFELLSAYFFQNPKMVEVVDGARLMEGILHHIGFPQPGK